MNNKSHIAYGLVIGLALMLYSVILYVTDLMQNPVLKYGSAPIMLVGILLSCFNYSKINQGAVTFGDVFTNGFKTTAVFTIISVVFTIIFLIAFPDVKEKALETARQEMEAKHTPQASIDQGIAIVEKFFMAIAIAGSLFGCLIYGAIFSVIGAAVVKKNAKPDLVSSIGEI